MSYLSEQRRAQQLCIVAVSLCMDRGPRTIQDIESFLLDHKERVDVSELYDVLLYAIGKGYLEYFLDPGRPTRYAVTAAHMEALRQLAKGSQPGAMVEAG